MRKGDRCKITGQQVSDTLVSVYESLNSGVSAADMPALMDVATQTDEIMLIDGTFGAEHGALLAEGNHAATEGMKDITADMSDGKAYAMFSKILRSIMDKGSYVDPDKGRDGAVSSRHIDIIFGLQTSGDAKGLRETLSAQNGGRIVSTDDIFASMRDGFGKMPEQYAVRDWRDLMAETAIEGGGSVVLADMGRDYKRALDLLNTAKDNGYVIDIHFVDADPQKSLARALDDMAKEGTDPGLHFNYMPVDGKFMGQHERIGEFAQQMLKFKRELGDSLGEIKIYSDDVPGQHVLQRVRKLEIKDNAATIGKGPAYNITYTDMESKIADMNKAESEKWLNRGASINAVNKLVSGKALKPEERRHGISNWDDVRNIIWPGGKSIVADASNVKAMAAADKETREATMALWFDYLTSGRGESLLEKAYAREKADKGAELAGNRTALAKRISEFTSKPWSARGDNNEKLADRALIVEAAYKNCENNRFDEKSSRIFASICETITRHAGDKPGPYNKNNGYVRLPGVADVPLGNALQLQDHHGNSYNSEGRKALVEAMHNYYSANIIKEDAETWLGSRHMSVNNKDGIGLEQARTVANYGDLGKDIANTDNKKATKDALGNTSTYKALSKIVDESQGGGVHNGGPSK